MRQVSSSATLPQIAQKRTFSLTSHEDLGEPAYVDRVGLEQVEGDALGALRPHAGKPARARR